MMYGPVSVDAIYAEAAGSLMLLALVLGLAMGSFGGFGLHAVLCRCSPFPHS